MRTSRGEVPSESALLVRVGPDAWVLLSAKERAGHVAGTFRGGANVLFENEAIVCFQSSAVPFHPWAVEVDLAWGEVREGDRVHVGNGRVAAGSLRFSMDEAEVVDLTFHPPANAVSLEELRERVALIERLLAETPDPFGSPFDRAFVRDRDRILAEWLETSSPEVLLALIGRGPGTTPAGDDTLVGLLAGLEVLSAVSPAFGLPLLQATCHKLLAGARRHTSALSAQLLSSAAAGCFPFPLLELQFAILDETASPACLAVTVSAALATGHTTGKTVLDGLIAARSARMSPGRGALLSERCAIPALHSPEGRRRDLPPRPARNIQNE